MDKKTIQENEFFGAPGGGMGSVTYAPNWRGAAPSPDVKTSPEHYSANTKTINHMASDNSGSTDYKDKKVTDLSPNKAASEFDTFQNGITDKPLNPEDKTEKDVNNLFTKKITPSPDDIMSALQYELSQMVKKDKVLAKQIVLKNLKSDPMYYRRLHMLNIDDEKMKVDETTTQKTKRVLDQMIAERKKQKPSTDLPTIDEIFKDLWAKRYGMRK